MTEWFYIIPPEEAIEKAKKKGKGLGRGWWGPPKGTHGAGTKGALLPAPEIARYKKAWQGRRNTASLEAHIRKEAYLAYFKRHGKPKTKQGLSKAKAAVDKLIASIKRK